MKLKLLTLIRLGDYSRFRQLDTVSRLGERLPGSNIYDFGEGIELHTYTGKVWFLYLDGALTQNEGLTDDLINKAFAEGVPSDRKKTTFPRRS